MGHSFPCGDCKYHGWLGLVQWCRHPDILEPLYPSRMETIAQDHHRCSSWVDWEAKVMPGDEPPWPMPLDLQELFPRNAWKNAEMKAENDAA